MVTVTMRSSTGSSTAYKQYQAKRRLMLRLVTEEFMYRLREKLVLFLRIQKTFRIIEMDVSVER